MISVKATAANPRRERRPFSTAEIVRIFSHPIFSGCLADTDRGLFSPGAVKIRDERFWIPILLFLTGARANEIAGLGLEEVQLQENAGYLVFRYTQLRRLKNKESERVIPLHPWALKLGFFDYVRSLPSGSTTLFPDLVERLRDQRSGSMTDDKVKGSSVFRQFNRTVLKHVGLGDDPDATLHSFRHVYEDAMTGKDIPDEVMFRLTGRAVGSSRQGYTRSLPADSVRLAERAAEFQKYVDRIDFGGLDLGHLFVDGHEVLSEPMS